MNTTESHADTPLSSSRIRALARATQPKEEDRLRWVGEFADPALEVAFRQKYAQQNCAFGRVIVVVATIATAALGAMDPTLLENETTVTSLWAVRAAFVVLSAVALVLLRGQPSPNRFIGVYSGWYLLTVGVHLFSGFVMPAGHTDMRLTATVAVLMTYTVSPLPLRYQTTGAFLHTAASLLLTGWLKPTGEGTAIISEVCWMGLTNVLGLFLSYLLHTRQRRLFAAVLRQTELSHSLGQALAEVKTLRGLIRVCAWCRKVDSEGVWQQLESYVKKHSHAEFTHGICPTCLETTTQELNETVS